MQLIAVFAPLIAFLLAGIFGRQIGHKGCQFVTCFGVILAAFASVVLFFEVVLKGQPFVTVLAPWVISGDFIVSWALRLDSLSVVMMCVINIVSACVHVYSIGYMSHDESRGRFMAYLSLFTFTMLMLVTSDNLLQLFFGWEGVGLASYLLIGFWNQKDSANKAAQKAFVVNRVGDFGLALGVMAIFAVFGSIDFNTIFDQAAGQSQTFFNFLGYQVHALTLIGLLLFMGAVGKSAQLGLHTWLPDAMEGPTPVSALIHAATMVTAGVFLVARFSPLYEYAPDALMVVTVFGATTAFVAATIGMTQFDIKRVIAYSTMSQLGYMFFALGVSAYGAAMFHLMTHAFFKALLFLGAGSVIHAMSDEQDMRRMGGLWKKIPVTYALMVIGSLALAGIPPLAGFYSKDIVLEAAWADQTWFGHYAYWIGITAAFMTAFYSWRLLIMTFHGQSRASQDVVDHIHESPSVMLGPLLILATGAIFAGFLFYGGFVGSAHHGDAHHGHEVIEITEDGEVHGPQALTIRQEAEQVVITRVDIWNKAYFWGESLYVKPENDTVELAHNVPKWVKLMPLFAGVSGIFLAYVFYLWRPALPGIFIRVFAWPHRLFFHKWYFDELYNRLFVRSARLLGLLFWKVGDEGIVDRYGPDGSAAASRRFAGILSIFQTGFVFQYAFVMMIALIAILSWFFMRHHFGLMGG